MNIDYDVDLACTRASLREFGTLDEHKHNGSPAYPQGGWACVVTCPDGIMFGEVDDNPLKVAQKVLAYMRSMKVPTIKERNDASQDS